MNPYGWKIENNLQIDQISSAEDSLNWKIFITIKNEINQ